MIENFIQTQQDLRLPTTDFESFQCGHSILQYQGQTLNLKNIDVAILGWKTNNYANIKKAFYQLTTNFPSNSVVDLGVVTPNIIPLLELVDYLVQNNVFPIIISPTATAIEGQLKAYEQRHELLNLILMDSKVQFTPPNSTAAPAVINQLLNYYPHLLFHLKCIGHQSYLNDQQAIEFLEDKYFEILRLGKLQARLEEIEPMVRDADLAAFSLASIRSADAPANAYRNPNGLHAAEACKIMRYTAMSDRLSSICLHGFDLNLDDHNQTANMIAQLVWFVIEGFFARTHEYPIDKKGLQTYLVDNKTLGMPIHFYKSAKSDRWWFEIPKALHPQHRLMACSYLDYQIACDGDLPDRIINAINRLS